MNNHLRNKVLGKSLFFAIIQISGLQVWSEGLWESLSVVYEIKTIFMLQYYLPYLLWGSEAMVS